MSAQEELIERLAVAEERLRARAAGEFPDGALTAPDPPTGERWEAGQVWAHLAEFVPYWMREASHVIRDGAGEPVPFGRTKSDTVRIEAIERDRRADRAALWQRIEASVAELRGFLEGLGPQAWRARGVHPTLGVMDLAMLLHEFLVGHLEQHADQLDDLAGT